MPIGLGNEVYDKIVTQDKKLLVSSVSSHYPMFQDEVWFCREIAEFIKLHL